MLSQILRVTTGLINTVNDAVIAMPATPLGPGGSPFAGQLGKRVELTPDMVFSDAAIGTVYGGTYRYVRLATNATTPLVVGQILFWDPSATDNDLYVVTTAEDQTTDHAVA